MKLFTQLALVSAIASCGSAYAMQSMDDAALSDTTGQDGITILIAPGTAALANLVATGGTTNAGGVAFGGATYAGGIAIGAAVLHDKDGIVDATNTSGTAGGAIILGDASQANSKNSTGVQMGIFASSAIEVDIDATGNGATGTNGTVSSTAPVLNVAVKLPSSLLIRTGDIWVDGSERGGIATGAAGVTATTAATGGTTGSAIKILNSMDIALGGATLNIQLGNTPQGAMINLSGTIANGLSISGLGLHDGSKAAAMTAGAVAGTAPNNNYGANWNGDLTVGKLTVTDTGTANANGNTTGTALTLAASIDVVNDVGGYLSVGAKHTQGGIVVTSTGKASDIMMENVTLGNDLTNNAGNTASTLGDLQLINVQTKGTRIAIMGH